MAKTNLDNKKLSPITKELSGIAQIKTNKTDKGLLIDALEKKYLQNDNKIVTKMLRTTKILTAKFLLLVIF